MNMLKKMLFSSILMMLFMVDLMGMVAYNDGSIVLENNRLKKTINASKESPSPIKVTGYFDKKENNELLQSESQLPWFEFVVNHRKVSSNDPFWVLSIVNKKELKNGGTHVQLSFQCMVGPVNGLNVIIHQILYPDSPLMREKIELKTSQGKEFTLNKYDDKLWFKFPQYSIRKKHRGQSAEIRMATWGKEAIDFNKNATYDDRKFDEGAYFNLANCHMFHPHKLEYQWKESDPSRLQDVLMKGPFAIIEQPGFSWLSTYEHASQDSREGLEQRITSPVSNSGLSADAFQGISGAFNMEEQDMDFWFLGLRHQISENAVDVSVEILRGGYLEDELISYVKPYTSVWTANAFVGEGESVQDIIHHYLLNQITKYPTTRKPEFYYNTWGMQRDLGAKGKDIREVFTEEQILNEIERAAKLNVDVFVLDDGWNHKQGVWKPHPERLPGGLSPLREAIEAHGMKMGIWLSPMGIARSAERFNNNPQWVIKDDNGDPISAQWGHPAFDFVSDFKDTLVADCKWLIDQGVRFFKWDAVNTFHSSLADLHHGSSEYSKEEIRERYEYMLPIYVTEAMLELVEYNENLVIEIDLTEARRALPGLITLQAGKFFWMNNGASGYGDYSTYRAKSMRTIPNSFNDIIPLDLFTYANYPHNIWPFFTQRYNVNSSLIAGYGFWGNLLQLSDEQLHRVGNHVAKSKLVLPYLKDVSTMVKGDV
ncbi:MAG TPA: alpha-galactosidase, partial [Bacteroidales bacterium]|nr:alpha-galactosidase [Bacteroidales bacterium]